MERNVLKKILRLFLGDRDHGEKNNTFFEYKSCSGIAFLYHHIYYSGCLVQSYGRGGYQTAGRLLYVGNQRAGNLSFRNGHGASSVSGRIAGRRCAARTRYDGKRHAGGAEL